ncbi:MAG TPA: mechanosensitive ion channel domain-containing protein [Microvirga sp.]|jgi:small-conductance mechanosensitive channel
MLADNLLSLSDTLQRVQSLWPAWLVNLTALLVAGFLLLFIHAAAFQILRFVLRGRLAEFGRKLLDRIRPPTRLGLLTVGLGLVLQALPNRGPLAGLLEWGLLFGFVIFVGWIAVAVIDVAADLYLRRVPLDLEDNLLTRKHLTQVRLLRRTAVTVVGFLTFSAVLMTIPSVRQYGVSLFASAGVAGLAVGLAARPVLSNLIAGVQIAIAQPIRLGDSIVVEGESGTVEEIQTTYVVVRLWDWRRLVVPLSYFMEKPFQNWTRESASLIGTVFWYVDYAVPVGAVREKYLELVRASALWDGQVAALHVSEATERTMQLRGIMSAANSSASWDLRCEIREKLVEWLRDTYPEALPKMRVEPEEPGRR